MGPRVGLNRCEKSRPPTGIRFPDRPARSQPVAIPRYATRPTDLQIVQPVASRYTPLRYPAHRSPDRPARSQSLYPATLTGSQK